MVRDDGIDHAVFAEIEIITISHLLVSEQLEHAGLGERREEHRILLVVVAVAGVKGHLKLLIGEHGKVAVVQVACLVSQFAPLPLVGERALAVGHTALLAVELQVGGSRVAIDETGLLVVFGIGRGDGGYEGLRVVHGLHLAVRPSLTGGPVYGLRALIGLAAHLHLARTAEHKGVAVDESGVGVDDRALLVERAVPAIYLLQVGEPLGGEVRVKLQSGHRLGHHAHQHIPVVEPVEGLHLAPRLSPVLLCLVLQIVTLVLQLRQSGMHLGQQQYQCHHHGQTYAHHIPRVYHLPLGVEHPSAYGQSAPEDDA